MFKFKINIANGFLSIVVISCVTLGISSCKKFVEIKPSSTVVAAANVFDKNTTATAAQLAIYAQMQTFPFVIEWETGLSSDELKPYNNSNTTVLNLYANKLNANADADNIGIWKPGYNFIYQANAVAEALSNSTGVTISAKKQLTGEAKFIRAYWNFYLASLYGDIPLITTTDYAINAKLVRTPKTQVFDSSISDLLDAQNLLNNNFVDVTDTVTTSERVRPTKWAATALLARIYLYKQDWANAEVQATAVINNTALFSLPTNLNSVFLKNSTEAIWQIMCNANTKYTTEAVNFNITSNPLTATGGANAISTQLLNAFEAGDGRKTNWVGSYTTATVPAATYYYANKYKANSVAISANASLANSEYIMVLRLAEQYLIRAEARVRLSTNIAGAVADLNVIRNRAGLGNYTGALDQASILNAILHERQVELFTEGHRWLDLKRTNTIDAVMTTVAPQKSSTWNSYQQLYPIPVSDIQNSAGNLTQNPNY